MIALFLPAWVIPLPWNLCVHTLERPSEPSQKWPPMNKLKSNSNSYHGFRERSKQLSKIEPCSLRVSFPRLFCRPLNSIDCITSFMLVRSWRIPEKLKHHPKQIQQAFWNCASKRTPLNLHMWWENNATGMDRRYPEQVESKSGSSHGPTWKTKHFQEFFNAPPGLLKWFQSSYETLQKTFKLPTWIACRLGGRRKGRSLKIC